MMSGFRTENLVLFVVLAAFAAVACGTKYSFEADFIERRTEWDHGYLKGHLNYLYDTQDSTNARIRFDYTVGFLNGSVVSALYHYENAAFYSMCSEECTGTKITELPDPWWVSGNLFEKTSTSENGMRWYVRKNDLDNETTQIVRILMVEDSAAPSNGYLGAVEFRDGRSLKIANVTMTNFDEESAIFAINEDCPQPTCPIYADIVFVLDTSGSVNYTEWPDIVYFVNGVMNSFTFGKHGVQAAVVQFCGQDDGAGDAKVYIQDPKCGKKQRFWHDFKFPKAKYEEDRMASVWAGAKVNGHWTVSSDRDELERALNATITYECSYPDEKNRVDEKLKYSKCQAFPKPRGTCQALGLAKAMEILDHSPRKEYNVKPHNIVIVVTDGEDKFPNITEGNATLLRQPPYNALVMEVGVALECEYDKDYLRRIASDLVTENRSAYFDAKDFNAIKRVTDEMFRPLCNTNFSSACGPECKGFCACGQCLCPECDESKDICHFISCNVSGSFTNGCVVLEEEKKYEDDFCTSYVCDDTIEHTGTDIKGEWVAIYNPCEQKNAENPGECRVVECDADFGDCRVSVNDSYCKHFARNTCEEWECTPLGTAIDTNPPHNETGCRVKRNLIEECSLTLGPRSACIELVCKDGLTVDSDCSELEVDTCTSMNTACMTYACQELAPGNGTYGCVGTETSHPANTSCTEWTCDDKEGWSIYLDRDGDYCKEVYKNMSGEIRCKNFACDPSINDVDFEGGCYYTNRTDCAFECQDDNETTCLLKGAEESRDDYCVLDYCVVKSRDGESYTLGCASDLDPSPKIVENCLDLSSSASKKAQMLNEANSQNCYTPYCYLGNCLVKNVTTDLVATQCMEPRCVRGDDGVWGWQMFPTQANTTCVSDGCYIRECIPDKGCVATDNCSVYSDECYSYTCEKDDKGARTCKVENLTANFLQLECLTEICDNGKKLTIYRNCTSDNLCEKGSCVKGQCVFTPTSPPGNDLCMNYTCDPKKGWSTAPKCVDGDYCTTDECWNYGTFHKCIFDPIVCSREIEMEGYDCFTAECKQNKTLQIHQCYRKLRPGAYIDICGNCIRSDPEYTAEGVDAYYNCTDAPPEPLMVESLAAATIALIIIGAIIAGATITTSGVMGTKALIQRARAANNQVAQSNPLFEGAETELTNPAFQG